MNLWITHHAPVNNWYITSNYPQPYSTRTIHCGNVDNLVKSFHRFSTDFCVYRNRFVELSTNNMYASSPPTRYII